MAIATTPQTFTSDRATARTNAPALVPYVLLVTGTALAIGAGALFGNPAEYLARDADLGRLLRGMALIKGLFVVLALGALSWRFKSPIGLPLALAYSAAVSLSAGASMLIWQLSAIGSAAVLFHTGEIALLLLAWRDRRDTRASAAGRS